MDMLVRLAPLIPDDLPLMFEWINNHELVVFNSPYQPVHLANHQAWFRAIQERKDLVVFGIRLISTDALIGSCQLHSIHPIHRSAELQIRLGQMDNFGQGYGTEAITLLIQYGFNDLNLERIYLHVFRSNERAIHVYEKKGFVQEGILRRAAYIDGKYVDVVIMGLLKAEYHGTG
jgi:RimJ/RimL family protein N-acetyltransferase